MLPVCLRVDAGPLHKWRGRLLFIFTKKIFVEGADAFASKLAPTFEMRSPVGASLLAKASLKAPNQF
jgi:hypothetical protein